MFQVLIQIYRDWIFGFFMFCYMIKKQDSETPRLHSFVRYFRPNVFTLAGVHASWKKHLPPSHSELLAHSSCLVKPMVSLSCSLLSVHGKGHDFHSVL